MNILFTTQPGSSVLHTMVPLAWALRTAGHEVRIASQPGFTDLVTQAGLTAVPVGRDRDPARMLGFADPEAPPEALMGLSEPYEVAEQHQEDITWEQLKADFGAEYVTWWPKMDNFPIIPDLVAFSKAWQPDLVIWEPLSYAGAIAAKACGAAHARLLWGLDVFAITREHYLRLKLQQPPEDRVDPLADWLGATAAKYGAEYSEDMTTGHFTIDQLPASLRTPADLHYVPMRYVPYGGNAVVPKWLWEPRERPRVAITLGVSASEGFGGYTVRTEDILDSLADLDIEVVATLCDEQRPEPELIPDNTRIVPYVPLHALAPTCAAVIHHAGFGTLCTTSLYGAPQLALPWDSDEPALARKLAERGAGLTVHADQATGDTVREYVLRLLDEPSFQQAADQLRAEMLAMPSPHDLVGPLEELTSEYRVAASVN